MFVTNAESLNVWGEIRPGVYGEIGLMRKESPKVYGQLKYYQEEEAPYVALTESAKFTKAYRTKKELFDEWDIISEEDKE